MDLFDQLKTAGPVDKAFKKNEKNAKNSSHGKDMVEITNKKDSSLGKEVESPNKKSASHGKEVESPSKKIASHGKDMESPNKKSSSHGKDVESPNKKSSSHGKDVESPNKKSSSHGKEVQTPTKKNSTHIKDVESDYKKASSHGKDVESHNKKNSTQVKNVEAHSKKNSSHDKDVESPNKKKHSHGKHGESPSKKSLSSQGKDVESFSKKDSSHRKDVETPNKKKSKEVETSNKNKSTLGKDVETLNKNKSNQGKVVEISSKKKTHQGRDAEETPSKKKATHVKDVEANSKRNSIHDKDVESNNKKYSSHSDDLQTNKKKISNHGKDVHSRKNLDSKVAKFNAKHKSNDHNSSHRRESLPSPVAQSLLKKKGDKSRSLSPPKIGQHVLKSLKIKLERKKIDDFMDHTPVVHEDSIDENLKHLGKHKDAKEPKKKTPTKAQQKLFEPTVRPMKTKDQILKEFNVKPCIVRMHRDNFKKLMREFKKNKSFSKTTKLILGTKRAAAPSPTGKPEGSPPAKKGKMVFPPKVKTSFFIKLATPKLDKSKLDKFKTEKKPKFPSKFTSKGSSSSVAQHNKIKNSKSAATTTPTKFSRSHLISSFGKRWFKSHVRVERCAHPLMLTFESNARARRLQTKHNKSKNLSVSFRDQVEVFGGSSDSDDSYDENFCAVPTTSRNGGRRANAANAAIPVVPATPLVMPARLKKVENGRVVDDILLDPSLFLDPQNIVASTPYSPGRKKRDHKSFSPLKDEGTPSPRKEQLKLANERIPPSGLRRLNIDEEDDEDDDCEYIVPIELPQRRTSRTSSTNTETGPTIIPPTFDDEIIPFSTSAIFTQIDEAITIAKGIVSPATVTTTTTKTDYSATKKGAATSNKITEPTNIESDNSESRESFQSAEYQPDQPISASPPLSLSDDFNHVAASLDEAPSATQVNNIPGLNGNVNNTLEGDISINDMPMNLFIEDSQTNEDSPEKTYVDSIINETIDKLGKDIGCDDSPADYGNAI